MNGVTAGLGAVVTGAVDVDGGAAMDVTGSTAVIEAATVAVLAFSPANNDARPWVIS